MTDQPRTDAKCRLLRYETAGHTAILDIDNSVGVLVVPGWENNPVQSTETQVVVINGLLFEAVVERCHYDHGSRQMTTWLREQGWKYAPNESNAGLPLELGQTNAGSTVYLLIPQNDEEGSGHG